MNTARIKAEDLQWQTWPAEAASNTFIRRSEQPDATNQVDDNEDRGCINMACYGVPNAMTTIR